MIDLIKLGERTYYVKCPTNVGIYLIDEHNVCLIDTGNSKAFGKVLEKILNEKNWNLKYIINTHSHADHIGGNEYLQNKFNCKIFANSVECCFINNPLLEPAMLYSANPPKEMKTNFLMAKESICEDIKNVNIDGIEIINLEGHTIGQIGVITSDGVCFCGDAYTSCDIIKKYAIQYVYDIEKYINTLDFLKSTNYNFYVPAHGEVLDNPRTTIEANIKNIDDIEKSVLKIIDEEISYNNFLIKIFNEYNIGINIIQHHLISATIKSFLTKLEKEEKIEFVYKNNELFLKSIKNI